MFCDNFLVIADKRVRQIMFVECFCVCIDYPSRNLARLVPLCDLVLILIVVGL